jgi:hypothetical protein
MFINYISSVIEISRKLSRDHVEKNDQQQNL